MTKHQTIRVYLEWNGRPEQADLSVDVPSDGQWRVRSWYVWEVRRHRGLIGVVLRRRDRIRVSLQGALS